MREINVTTTGSKITTNLARQFISPNIMGTHQPALDGAKQYCFFGSAGEARSHATGVT